jgi:hypothetical protein
MTHHLTRKIRVDSDCKVSPLFVYIAYSNEKPHELKTRRRMTPNGLNPTTEHTVTTPRGQPPLVTSTPASCPFQDSGPPRRRSRVEDTNGLPAFAMLVYVAARKCVVKPGMRAGRVALDLARRFPWVAARSLLSVVEALEGDRPRIFPRRAYGGKADSYGRLMMRIVLVQRFSSSLCDSSTGIGILRFLERVILLVSPFMIGSNFPLWTLQSMKILSPFGLASHLIQHVVLNLRRARREDGSDIRNRRR